MDKQLLIILGTIPWILFYIYFTRLYNQCSSKSSNVNKMFIFVFLFAALRYGVGYDYFAFKELLDGRTIEESVLRLEILHQYAIKYMGEVHYQIYFASMSFFTIYPVYFLSKKMSINPALSLAIYVFFPMFFLDGLAIIRNAVAFGCSLIMFYCLYKKKIKTSLLFWILAMGSHNSAIVAGLIYIIYYINLGKKVNCIFYIVSLFSSIIIVAVINNYFQGFMFYAQMAAYLEEEKGGGKFLVILINAINIFNLIYFDKIKNQNKKNRYYLSFVNIGTCFYNTFISIEGTMASRLSTYFLLYMCILLPSYPSIFPKTIIKNKTIYNFFALLFATTFFLQFVGYVTNDIHMGFVPYQLFFLNPSDIFDYTR